MSESETKRYFECEEMDHLEDDTGVSWSIVARDMPHALEILSGMFLGSECVKIEIKEITAESAAEHTTYDDDKQGRDVLTKWPIGTALCSEY